MSDENKPAEVAALVAELRAHLTWAADAGVKNLGTVAAPQKVATQNIAPQVNKMAAPVIAATISRSPDSPPRDSSPDRPMPKSAPLPVTNPPLAHGVSGSSLKTLEAVRAEIGDCTRCKLHKGRHNIVFGVGSPKARLVFVGEAPGEDEDLQGIPFVGKAGQLLTKMIEAMGLTRDEVYICNTVKCRPPNNRNPEPDELGACEPFLVGQLASLKAECIVTLGKFAAQALLRDQTPISRLRGQWRTYAGVPLMPTFHPAYLLRSPGEKGKVWSDLQQVMGKLGLQPPKKAGDTQ